MRGRLRHSHLSSHTVPSSSSGLFGTRLVTKGCTLRSIREEVGLGSPPAPYYTNDNESINAAIKEKVNYNKSEWPQFNAKLNELVDSQMQEAEKAIIGCGEYRIRDEYKHLMVPVEKWNRLSEEQRKRAIQKFHSACVRKVQIRVKLKDVIFRIVHLLLL